MPDSQAPKSNPRPLSLYLVFYAVVILPIAAVLFMIVSVVISLFRGTNFLAALGRGALVAVFFVAAIAVLQIIKTAVRSLFARRNQTPR